VLLVGELHEAAKVILGDARPLLPTGDELSSNSSIILKMIFMWFMLHMMVYM
tara:strand:+ start:209 stop:364 length:156 start_codon:yes stop_codon:yes gene_type:complete